MSRTLIALLISLMASATHASDDILSLYERRLAPITIRDAPGAFGTTWSTAPLGLNEVNSVQVFGLSYVAPTFTPVRDSPWFGAFISTRPGDAPGSILYVPREHAEKVHLVTNLRQSSGAFPGDVSQPQVDDVLLPVVKESEFSDRPLYFFRLQNSELERTHLRVYSLDIDRHAVAVRVQIHAPHPQLGWQLRHDQILDLRRNPEMTTGHQPILPLRPWATEIAVDPLMEATGLPGPYMIKVTPETPGTKIWAFVSETHNEIQRIQLVMPQ